MSRRRTFGGLLWRLADFQQVVDRGRSFRARAYRRAVWALDDLDPELDVDRARILETPGIGTGIASLIEEFQQTGGITRLRRLETTYPREAPLLQRLPRMTASRLRALKSDVGVETVSDLTRSIESGDALTVPGVGEATIELWSSVIDLPDRPDLVPAHRAWVTAEQLAAHVQRHTGNRVHLAGGVRRIDEWVAGLDLVITTESDDDVRLFLDSTAVLARWNDALGEFETHSGILGNAHFTQPDWFGTVMIAATGPETHVHDLMGDREFGRFTTEDEAYAARGIDWVPPAARRLPLEQATSTVRVEDIRGDLHIHTDRSPDGRMRLETVLTAAVERGYEYLLITDHTIGLRFGGLDPSDLAMQKAHIEAIAGDYQSLVVFHGAEVNIDQDGGLDLDDEAFTILDFVVAGLHSHFGLAREIQTRRLATAVAHPAVRVLAHPTGRRIGIRPGISVDMEAVIDAAVTHDCALECNGHRDRLDLSSAWVRIAAERGASFAANSDAHRAEEMRNLANAVATLQAAGIGPDRVVNGKPLPEMLNWVGD